MRRVLLPLAAGMTAAVFVAGTVGLSARGPAGGPCQPVAQEQQAWVQCMLDNMTVEQKVGQMFVINGFGQTVDDATASAVSSNRTLFGPEISNMAELIEAYQPGGIVYFSWSNTLSSPSQVDELSNGVQRVAMGQPNMAPMLISIDQEEGEVLRIGSPAAVFPGNMALGATRSTQLAHRSAAITGRELKAMGINVDNAPVVDTNTNPKNIADGIRSFGDRTGFVSRFGEAAIRGYERGAHVSAVAKHWPGLGGTSTNPDNGITVSDQTLAELRQQQFPAFEAAMDAGVDSVMVTHIEFPKILPPGLPSSLSPLFVEQILRGELGFSGVIVTDALNAQALANFTPEQVALMAVEAGHDQLLEIDGFPTVTGQSIFIPAYNAVLDAVQSGQIPLSRIEESVTRILTQKWKVGLAEDPLAPAGDVNRLVGSAQHLAVARATAKRSLTLLKNKGDALPLRPHSDGRVLSTGWGQTSTPLIANEIASRDVTAQSMRTGANPTAQEIAEVKRAAREYDAVVVNTFNLWAPNNFGQIRLIRELTETGAPVIVLALGTPYDIAYVPQVDAFLSTYDFQPTSINAGVAALFGQTNPRGRLPVTVPKANHQGRTMFPFGFGRSYERGR
jgi:beta-N-acetylhexosaminidase